MSLVSWLTSASLGLFQTQHSRRRQWLQVLLVSHLRPPLNTGPCSFIRGKREPACFRTRFYAYMFCLLAWYFCGTPNCGRVCFCDSLACSWDSFPPAGSPCPAWTWGILPCLIVSCAAVFGCCVLEACSFLQKKPKWSGSEGDKTGEGVGRSGGRGNCAGNCIVCEKNVLSKKLISKWRREKWVNEERKGGSGSWAPRETGFWPDRMWTHCLHTSECAAAEGNKRNIQVSEQSLVLQPWISGSLPMAWGHGAPTRNCVQDLQSFQVVQVPNLIFLLHKG